MLIELFATKKKSLQEEKVEDLNNKATMLMAVTPLLVVDGGLLKTCLLFLLLSWLD